MMKHLIEHLGMARWKPRHYAAAAYFSFSLCPLAAADGLPWWGVMLAVANFALAARCAMTIPVPEDDERKNEG